MSRPAAQRGCGEIHDRGCDGWDQAVEIVDPPDLLRIGSPFSWEGCAWRIAGISRLKPLHGGIVIRLRIAPERDPKPKPAARADPARSWEGRFRRRIERRG